LHYKIVITKCIETQLAENIALELTKILGISKETVFNALVNKNVCLKMECDEPVALNLKTRLETVGASVKLIESDVKEPPAPVKPPSAPATPDAAAPDNNRLAKIDNLLSRVDTDWVYISRKKKSNNPEKEAAPQVKEQAEQVEKKPVTDDKKKKREKKEKKPDKEKPVEKQNAGDKLITAGFREEYIKELFRSLRTKILMGLYDLEDKSLVITGLDAGTGKSMVSSNIAIAIAQQNKKTLLIDGDLRRGTLHTLFSLEQSPGLSDLILSKTTLSDESINTYIKPTSVPDLFIIPSGPYVANSSELLTSDRFLHLKKSVSEKFEIVILDTPPLGALIDAVVVSRFFSRYIVVVKAGVTNVVDMKKKINEHPAVKEKLLGLVLNYAATDTMRSYYKKSKYY